MSTATPAYADTTLSAPLSSGPAPGGAVGTTSVYALDFGGVTRSYRLFVPTKAPTGPRPLLVALHSFNQYAALFETGSGYDTAAGRGGILVVYPDGLGRSWNAGFCCGTASAAKVDDVGFIAAVIADVALRQSVDRLRIAIAGGSNGGMMAFRFACERSDLVDTIVVLAGAFVAPGCKLSRPVSILQEHGLLDTLVPPGGGVSSISATPFPKIQGPLGGIAMMDGCRGYATSPWTNAKATLLQITNCPAGTFMWLVTSSTLGHTWSNASTVAQYGLDMTGNTWGFTAGVWASRGPAVAL